MKGFRERNRNIGLQSNFWEQKGFPGTIQNALFHWETLQNMLEDMQLLVMSASG
jgi:hypothetical protein